MIDCYIGVIGEPNSVIELEFDSFAEASAFCDTLAAHYKQEKKRLYLAIDNTPEFYDLDEVYRDAERKNVEINADTFAEICKLQAQIRD